MNYTHLKFSSAIYLVAFRRFSKARFWEIDLQNLTVCCDCSAAETRVACRDFCAILVTKEEKKDEILLPDQFAGTPGRHRAAS